MAYTSTPDLGNPRIILHGSRRVWLFPDGTTLPVVSGGADGDTDAAGGDSQDAAAGDSQDNRSSGTVDKTFTQTELDRIVGERLARERKSFADYDDLKAKAAKFDEIEAANKSDVEKANDAAAAEKLRADTEAARAARLQAALDHKLAPEDLKLLEHVPADQVDAVAKTLAERLATTTDPKDQRRADAPNAGRHHGKHSRKEQGRDEARRRFGDPHDK